MFSLLETILTMSIGLILLLSGLPAFHDLLARNHTAQIVNQLTTAIQAARSEALAQGQTVSFCGSGDGIHCDGVWRGGQLLLLDQSQQLLRVYSGVAAGDRLWWQSSFGRNNALKLTATGFTDGQQGSFYYCPHHDATRYGVRMIVSASARVRTESSGDVCGTISTL